MISKKLTLFISAYIKEEVFNMSTNNGSTPLENFELNLAKIVNLLQLKSPEQPSQVTLTTLKKA